MENLLGSHADQNSILAYSAYLYVKLNAYFKPESQMFTSKYLRMGEIEK